MRLDLAAPTTARLLRIIAHPLLVRLSLDAWETDPLPRCPRCGSPLVALNSGATVCLGCAEEAARAK